MIRTLTHAVIAATLSTTAHTAAHPATSWDPTGTCHAGDRTYQWDVQFTGLHTDRYGVVRSVAAVGTIWLENDSGTKLIPDRYVEWYVHTYQTGPDHTSPVQTRSTDAIGTITTNPYNSVYSGGTFDTRYRLYVAEWGHPWCAITLRPPKADQ